MSAVCDRSESNRRLIEGPTAPSFGARGAAGTASVSLGGIISATRVKGTKARRRALTL